MATRKPAKKVVKKAAKKVVAHSRKKAITLVRCSEITNRLGKFYRCIKAENHRAGCAFGGDELSNAQSRKLRGIQTVRRTPQNGEELFLAALTEFYSGDPIAPGFVTAWVPKSPRAISTDTGMWYASVTRYTGGTTKLVVCSYQCASSLADAKQGAITRWREIISRAAKPALRRFLRGADVELL